MFLPPPLVLHALAQLCSVLKTLQGSRACFFPCWRLGTTQWFTPKAIHWSHSWLTIWTSQALLDYLNTKRICFRVWIGAYEHSSCWSTQISFNNRMGEILLRGTIAWWQSTCSAAEGNKFDPQNLQAGLKRPLSEIPERYCWSMCSQHWAS